MEADPLTWSIRREGDSAVVVVFPEYIDPVVNAHCAALACEIRSRQLPWIRDVVEAYASVTVYIDALAVDDDTAIEIVQGLANSTVAITEEPPPLRLPVCYGGEYGPDILEVSRYAQCSERDVVRRHSSVTYRVYMLGFLPGFAYLGKVDQAIAIPRRNNPRLVVEAGSVGIAGQQTGVYPSRSPGGWQIIGRCPIRVIDWSKKEPFLLGTGGSVRFDPVSEEEYQQLEESVM